MDNKIKTHILKPGDKTDYNIMIQGKYFNFYLRENELSFIIPNLPCQN